MNNNTLQWEFDGSGEWEAKSAFACSDGDYWIYRIQVCDDGSFDLSRSDAVLDFKGFPCLQTLEGAKSCCEIRESQVKAMSK